MAVTGTSRSPRTANTRSHRPNRTRRRPSTILTSAMRPTVRALLARCSPGLASRHSPRLTAWAPWRSLGEPRPNGDRSVESCLADALQQARRGAHDHQVAAQLAGPGGSGEQGAERGVVEHRDAVEVDGDFGARMLGDRLQQAVAQRRHGGEIEFAVHVHHRPFHGSEGYGGSRAMVADARTVTSPTSTPTTGTSVWFV